MNYETNNKNNSIELERRETKRIKEIKEKIKQLDWK